MVEQQLTQLVVFRTAQPAEDFVAGWRPFASSFLARGISSITWAQFDDGHDGIRYISRNTWPADDYRHTFPVLPGAAGGGGVAVEQAGAYRATSGAPVAEARPDLDLALVLLGSDDDGAVEAVTAAISAATPDAQVVGYRAELPEQPHRAVVTAHGPAGTGAATSAAVRTWAAERTSAVVVLTGTELLTLAP